ncbi:hypothetical protein APHAL10511_003607 [Amanita phalloides]|nr:hypothetical protein APHAL10511_003607 [Amanita phalloides]
MFRTMQTESGLGATVFATALAIVEPVYSRASAHACSTPRSSTVLSFSTSTADPTRAMAAVVVMGTVCSIAVSPVFSARDGSSRYLPEATSVTATALKVAPVGIASRLASVRHASSHRRAAKSIWRNVALPESQTANGVLRISYLSCMTS